MICGKIKLSLMWEILSSDDYDYHHRHISHQSAPSSVHFLQDILSILEESYPTMMAVNAIVTITITMSEYTLSGPTYFLQNGLRALGRHDLPF